ncbi:hypothetical protein [Paraburkholderia aspalathi]|uniref:hypothetical protein n=1 Tax=Paraburkholderia aspalathi TaxID=1324617 RepID=UPI001BABC2A7|nr:hypothetical protein [Paraburkholderia aspalathi]
MSVLRGAAGAQVSEIFLRCCKAFPHTLFGRRAAASVFRTCTTPDRATSPQAIIDEPLRPRSRSRAYARAHSGGLSRKLRHRSRTAARDYQALSSRFQFAEFGAFGGVAGVAGGGDFAENYPIYVVF